MPIRAVDRGSTLLLLLENDIVYVSTVLLDEERVRVWVGKPGFPDQLRSNESTPVEATQMWYDSPIAGRRVMWYPSGM